MRAPISGAIDLGRRFSRRFRPFGMIIARGKARVERILFRHRVVL
jgi:hypothetical protein